jgi:hypothetical protein
MNVPDYISPFTAYRTWHWEPDGTVLSLNTARWLPGEAHVAKCNNNHSHESPDRECTCGIYAAKHWKHLIDIGYAGYGIHGEVALWGKIEECHLGYRAQYAYPKHFIVPPNMLTADMRETERKMQALVAFNVDIFIATDNQPKVDTQKIPLWVRDFGYSAQGIDFITNRIQRFYSYHDDGANNPAVGDRLCITNEGISVVTEITEKEIFVCLYNQTIHRIPREKVCWNRGNNRWESGSLGWSITASAAG